MKYISEWATKAKEYIEEMDFSKGAMRYILWYAALLVLCCFLYLSAWGFKWFFAGDPNLKELLDFLHEIASASWVAVIGFVCKGLVDKDENGIPDEFEGDDKHGNNNIR